MEGRDAKTILCLIHQDRPAPKSWRELNNRSPEFTHLMEEIEQLQLKNSPSPRLHLAGVLRDLDEIKPTAKRALRFSSESQRQNESHNPEHSLYRTAQPRRFFSASSASHTAAVVPTPSQFSDRIRYLGRHSYASSATRSVYNEQYGEDLEDEMDEEDDEEGLQQHQQYDEDQFDDDDEEEEEQEDEDQDDDGVEAASNSIFDEMVVARSSTTTGILRRRIVAAEEEEEEQQVDQPEDDDMAASERLARELMEAEQAELLQRLHAEQQRALEQLRSAGGAEAQTWMNEDSDEAVGEQQGEEEREMTYDELLELGETLGDVRTERWRARSAQVAANLPTLTYQNVRRMLPMYRDELCVICQFSFESAEEIKLMPNCTHCFHADCADAWIKDHDRCATCKAAVE